MYDLKQRLSALAQGLPVAVKAYVCGSAFPDVHVFAYVNRSQCGCVSTCLCIGYAVIYLACQATVHKVLPLFINYKGKCVQQCFQQNQYNMFGKNVYA